MTQVSTRDVPWAKVGTVIDEPMTAAQAMKLAHLDFEVKRKPIAFKTTKGEWQTVPGRDALVDPKGVMYGLVASSYEIVQYRDAFTFIDSISPQIVAAGSLRGGKQAFMVVQAPQRDKLTVLGDDKHDLYVILRTSHDCTKAVEITIMPLRGACMNQLPFSSFGRNARQRWSIRHTTGARQQLIEASNIVRGLDEYAREFTQTAETLAKAQVSEREARRVLEAVLPDRPRRTEVIDTVVASFLHSETVGQVGTGWGLVNAIGEYFEHSRRGAKPEARITNALSGSTFKAVNRTAQLLMRR